MTEVLLRLTIFIGFPLLLVTAMVAVGLMGLRSANTKQATIYVGISHGIGCFMLLAGLCFLVPEFRKVFTEFDLELPPSTELLVRISDTAFRGFFLLVPAVGGFLAAIIVLFRNLHRDPKSRGAARLLWAAVTGIFTLCFFIAMYGLVLPLFKLIEGLS